MNNPILFLIYNRPKETAISFEQIRINQPSELFIAADGADISKPQDEIRCRAVREIVANIDWPCQVKYLLRDEHLGAREGVSNK